MENLIASYAAASTWVTTATLGGRQADLLDERSVIFSIFVARRYRLRDDAGYTSIFQRSLPVNVRYRVSDSKFDFPRSV